MIGIARVQSKQLSICQRYLHFFKVRELNEPEFFKTQIDPEVLALINKNEPDILYSSYVELNKKRLSLKHRLELLGDIKNKQYVNYFNKSEDSSSVLIDKISKSAESGSSNENILVQEDCYENKNENEGMDTEQKEILARSKLKILTEMGFRRSALEHEIKSLPDNWMEDYETFDESDIAFDTQYGTSGIFFISYLHLSIVL